MDEEYILHVCIFSGKQKWISLSTDFLKILIDLVKFIRT